MIFDSKEIEMLFEESRKLREQLLDTAAHLSSYTDELRLRIKQLRESVKDDSDGE